MSFSPEEVLKLDYENTLAAMDKYDDHVQEIKNWSITSCGAVLLLGLNASDHGALVEHEETLHVLQHLTKNDRLPKPATIKPKNRSLGFKKASRAKADPLVVDCREHC